MRVLIATSNQGKLRDFAGAAAVHGIEVEGLRGFASLPTAVENGASFEENARKKAEHYSRFAPGELVLADDSGLSVDALDGAPGVYSARYAALRGISPGAAQAGVASHDPADQDPANHDPADQDQANRDRINQDQANNSMLLRELERVAEAERGASFVCVLSAARDGREVAQFRGEARGVILRQERGQMGFGYDPLFYLPALARSFAELAPEEKARVSHRGGAFYNFLEWARKQAR
jgi:XTP/dITP diphosphohydrolase